MSLEKSRKILQKMWERCAKPGADGRKYIVIKDRADVEYHYWSGFVDDEKFSVQEWADAFQDSLLAKGVYLVNEDQWLAKAKYHYSGPIHPPWDPMTIREGEWDETELETLAWEKLKPNVYFSKEDFAKVIAEVKRTIPKASGKYVIGRALKQDWTEFVNTYASPRRVLQMGVAQLKAARGQPISPQAPVQTGFVQGPSASRQIADKLSQLIGRREK